MGPRAAARLGTLGFEQVYDYVSGKSDWIAAGLPTVRQSAGLSTVGTTLRAGDILGHAGERLGDVARRARAEGKDEVIVVDDASSDETPAVLLGLLGRYERLSVLRLSPMPSGGPNGQSAAFGAGVRAARGELIAMLDADLQNDPADLGAMLELLERTGADMVQGDRRRARRDSLGRRVASGVGRLFRRLLLGDTIKDTGCSLRVMRRAVAVAMPFEFRGMHRFVPITARQLGYTVVEKPVGHRPRVAGKAKYGVLDRALPGLHDCFGVRWMAARRRSPRCERIERPAPPPADPAAATERATT